MILAKTYDPAQVLASFAGVQITGFAPDTFIKIEREEDSVTKIMGSDGEGTRVIQVNLSGAITFTLMQTSQSNDFLEAQLELDELEGGLGSGALLIKDLNGSSNASAQVAWVKRRPPGTFGKELHNREWTLETTNLVVAIGGQKSLLQQLGEAVVGALG